MRMKVNEAKPTSTAKTNKTLFVLFLSCFLSFPLTRLNALHKT